MIKILRAHEVPLYDERDYPRMFIEIEIDGYKWSGGGFDPSMNRTKLMALLEADHDDLLRKAKQMAAQPPSPTFKERNDLLDTQPRDLEAEVDDLKGRVIALEPKQL